MLHGAIFSCFQGDVLCDIDNCINPWFTESAGKETVPFPSVGFLIAQWSVIYSHLHLSPLCMHVLGAKSAVKLVFLTVEMTHEREHCCLLILSVLQCFVFTSVRYVCMSKASFVRDSLWHPVFSVSEAKSIHVNFACAKSTVKIFMDENTTLLSVCNFHCVAEQSSCLRLWWLIHFA